jgi:glycosyltransferase involved in cell wall biosynthesis
MKIAIVCFYLDAPGGTQRQAFSLANELQAEGHVVKMYTAQFEKKFFPKLHQNLDIQVIAPTFSRAELFGATNIIQTVIKKWKRDKAFIQFAKHIAHAMDPDFDVVNSHDYDAYKVGYFYKQRKPTTKHVWMMNEIPFSYTPKKNLLLEIGRRIYDRYLNISEKKYFKSIDRVANLNEFDASWARKTFNLSAHLVESGCNGKDFFAPVHPPMFESGKLNATKSVVLLGMGICAPYRRFEDIIEATAMLRKENYPVTAKIVGTNANMADGYPQSLVELAKMQGIAEYVSFDFKSISDAELKNYYATSHVFVFPTYVGAPRNGYGWGLAAFEAMSAGLPVILCKTTASTRLLHDGIDALLVDHHSPEQIVAQVRKLISSEASYRAIAEAGQKLALERVTWKSYAHQMLVLFEGEIKL